MSKLSCPNCRKLANGGRGCLLWAGVILLFPIGLILLLLPVTYRCTSCGFIFKK